MGSGSRNRLAGRLVRGCVRRGLRLLRGEQAATGLRAAGVPGSQMTCIPRLRADRVVGALKAHGHTCTAYEDRRDCSLLVGVTKYSFSGRDRRRSGPLVHGAGGIHKQISCLAGSALAEQARCLLPGVAGATALCPRPGIRGADRGMGYPAGEERRKDRGRRR